MNCWLVIALCCLLIALSSAGSLVDRDVYHDEVTAIKKALDTIDQAINIEKRQSNVNLVRRGWLKKVWKAVKNAAIVAGVTAVIGKRDLENESLES